MIKLVEKYLKDNRICNCNILVGLSGGPDSVSLLYTLSDLSSKYKLNIVAAYVNHGIRSDEENKIDQELIVDICNTLNVELHIKKIEPGYIIDRSKSENSSTEVVARNIRYSFFKSVKNIDYIAVGHNRDDQVETMLMRFFQGSTLDGLVGIPTKNGNIIRPLIEIDKTIILDFLKKNSLKYNIDKTNLESNYLRNRVRNNLIPIVKEIFPGYKNSFQRLNDEFTSYINFYNANRSKINWLESSNGFYVEYSEFIELTLLERKTEIYNIFNILFKDKRDSYRLPGRFLKPLYKRSFKNGEIILDGHGLRFYCKKPYLFFIGYK